MESMFLDLANQSNQGYISEYGELERWKGGVDINKISADITKAAKEARKNIQKKLKIMISKKLLQMQFQFLKE